ncbi:ATP-binding protein [Massilia forsythiae]|uniref:ATP-binding protein n=1 Tax=Massilia forsythiae TaxID=2728020 RepID=A0A7Z2ZVI7_9BURK|nr:ATP-binding protein [Massilia forsythiae]QJE03400.1 ATP-binding protein [Massilia forsythiae]
MRIAILGAESTGKSTLAAALARRHGSLWVPEYLREFVDVMGRVPHEDDQPGIARTQLAREDALALRLAQAPAGTWPVAAPVEQAAPARRLLFCDTTPLMTAVYSRIYWGRLPDDLLALEAAHDYALTLVAAPDLPWVADGLQRDSEAVRRRVHAQLLAVLQERGIAYVLLTGELAQRMERVEALLAAA